MQLHFLTVISGADICVQAGYSKALKRLMGFDSMLAFSTIYIFQSAPNSTTVKYND